MQSTGSGARKPVVDDIDNAIDIAFQTLGYSSAKWEQIEAMWCNLFGCDCFVTGFGKSANFCVLPLCCPHASGTFLCCQQLLFSLPCIPPAVLWCHCSYRSWRIKLQNTTLWLLVYSRRHCKLITLQTWPSLASPRTCNTRLYSKGESLAQIGYRNILYAANTALCRSLDYFGEVGDGRGEVDGNVVWG